MRITALTEYMGQLLGPKAIIEIVVTHYEDGKVNYQVEGMRGPVAPEDACNLLALVHQELAKHVTPKETPV